MNYKKFFDVSSDKSDIASVFNQEMADFLKELNQAQAENKINAQEFLNALDKEVGSKPGFQQWRGSYLKDRLEAQIALNSFKKGDKNYLSIIDKINSWNATEDRDRKLKELALIAYQKNDPVFQILLKKCWNKEELKIAIIINKYKTTGKIDKNLLNELESSGYGWLKSQALSELAVCAAKNNRSYDEFLQKIPDIETGYKDQAIRQIVVWEAQQKNTLNLNLLNQITEDSSRNKRIKDEAFAIFELIKVFFEKENPIYLELIQQKPDISNSLLRELAVKAYRKDDQNYHKILEQIIEQREKENVFKFLAVEKFKKTLTLKQAYNFWQLTKTLNQEKIKEFLATLPKQATAPGSPWQAEIINRLIKDQPELFLEQFAGIQYQKDEFSGEILTKKVFGPEMFSNLSEQDRKWAQMGFNADKLNQDLPDLDPSDYLAFQESGAIESGDPRGEPKEVLKTNLPAGTFLALSRIRNINNRGRGKAEAINLSEYPEQSEIKSDKPYQLKIIPELKIGQTILATPLNSQITELKIESETKEKPTSNQTTISQKTANLNYQIEFAPPLIEPLNEYANDNVSQELKTEKLPQDIENFIDSIRAQPLNAQLKAIQGFMNQYFIYDQDNKRVANLKQGETVRRRLLIMRQRAGEIKKVDPNNSRLRNVKYAGVCSDYALIAFTMLSKLDVPGGVDIGFLAQGETVTTQQAHSQIVIPFRDSGGKRYDLEFDPVNNTISIGRIKMPTNQLSPDWLIEQKIKKPLTKTQKGKQTAASLSERQLSAPEIKQKKYEQTVNEKIGAIAAKIADQGLRKTINEQWNPEMLSRFTEVDRYFVAKILAELIKTMPETEVKNKIIKETLRLIKNPKITAEKLKTMLQDCGLFC